MMPQDNFDEYDIYRHGVGDDVNVGGVVYSWSEWVDGHKDTASRRRAESRVETGRSPETGEPMPAGLAARAKKLGRDFTDAAKNMSTGPGIAELLRAHAQLISDAAAEGFDRGRVEEDINAAFDQ
jgi:hypothetical protein